MPPIKKSTQPLPRKNSRRGARALKNFLKSLTPDQVCAWMHSKLRAVSGDSLENKTKIFASNGYYVIKFPARSRFAQFNGLYRRSKLSDLFDAIGKEAG
jgi:hypothetical protein